MKSYPKHRFGITVFIVLSTWLVCEFMLARPNDVRAAPTKDETDGKSTALQDILHKKRPRGPVFVAVPRAYPIGVSASERTYCSPSIVATNSSNTLIEELIIGIEYITEAGKRAGTTVTRYSNIKPMLQDTQHFYQLSTSECKGIDGQVSVVRCVYSTGEDCSSQVQPIGFGAIPLRLKSR